MIGWTKVTVLMLYRRVFSTHHRSWFDRSIITLITVLALFYGITTFFKIFECAPRAKIFDMALPGHCYNVGTILVASGAFNFATDFLILLLPVNAVQKLQMSKQKKLLVVLVFTFGLWYVVPNYLLLVPCTVKLTRTSAPVFATIGFVIRLERSSNKDTSWGQPTILLWGSVSSSLSLSLSLCVCVSVCVSSNTPSQPRRTHQRQPLHQRSRNGPSLSHWHWPQ